MLIGRRKPDAGEIRVLGRPLTPQLRARMGIVFQEPSLDAAMTVRETMHLQGRMFGLSRAVTALRASLLLDRVGLSDRASAMTSTLSGGMKRRLELARALLTQPALLLLDEPTLALDLDSKQSLWQHPARSQRGRYDAPPRHKRRLRGRALLPPSPCSTKAVS